MNFSDRVRKYKLEAVLGEGGMGVVWQAYDVELDRYVALKAIHEKFSLDPELRKRFIDEARIQARLVHQNICTLFDAFEEDRRLYIVQEYVDGVTLKKMIEDAHGPLPIDQVIKISQGVLAGLAHAHEEGVIHRDIKPSNIMVDAKGRVKIMDFGIAKALGAERMGKTKTGMTVGTPEYMSPEQILGKEVDARSDIYSFGIMLYEMLTGKLPFDPTSSEFEIQQFHVEGQLPAIDPSYHVPQHLMTVLTKTTEKNRDERFVNAAQVAQYVLFDIIQPLPPASFTTKTALVSCSRDDECPLCRAKRFGGHKPKILYGVKVCRHCRNSFANRRQIAFFLDQIIYLPVSFFLGAIVGSFCSLLNTAPSVNFWLGFVIASLAFDCKDGFAGYSPGKAICGVRVIDRYTGKPAGFWASLLRNLPLNIPFMPLFVFVQLLWGHRVGDGWSSTKVIWKRYADHPLFGPEQR